MKNLAFGKKQSSIFMHMPVNTAARAVVRSPGKTAPLAVLCLRVGAFTSFLRVAFLPGFYKLQSWVFLSFITQTPQLCGLAVGCFIAFFLAEYAWVLGVWGNGNPKHVWSLAWSYHSPETYVNSAMEHGVQDRYMKRSQERQCHAWRSLWVINCG